MSSPLQFITDITLGSQYIFPTMLFRVVVSLTLGLLIGLEREVRRQPAGLRTHMLICVGSTVATLLSIYLPVSVAPLGLTGDAARIAAQIISGVGFLGAGAIIKMGASVRGITTAATIWTVAAIGMAVGAGMIITAVATTAFVLLILVIFERFEKRHFYSQYYKIVEVDFIPEGISVADIKRRVARDGVRIRTVDIRAQKGSPTYQASIYCYFSENINQDEFLHSLLALENVLTVSVHQTYK
ncbi:MAG: hypothetical protein CSA07_03285 [Bacteroidia bacterium]|nr:MAG: hypothetical protein CSA07_03285 [Bacteroidia bacterium]